MIGATKHILLARLIAVLLTCILTLPYGIQFSHAFLCSHDHESEVHHEALEFSSLEDDCELCKFVFNTNFIKEHYYEIRPIKGLIQLTDNFTSKNYFPYKQDNLSPLRAPPALV